MNQIVKIAQTEVPVKEYRGERVVTFKDIDRCHGRPDGTAGRNFRANKQHMIEGVDYFEINITGDEIRRQFGAGKNAGRTITAITQSGYLMLVKSFTDDLAWEVQRQLVNTYFKKHENADLKLQIQQERAHAMAMNAKIRQMKLILQVQKQAPALSAVAEKVLGIAIMEQIGATEIPDNPVIGKSYTAEQLAAEVGSNKITVGKRATQAGLKTDEYGETVLNHVPGQSKQVPQFIYNENGRQAVLKLFGKTSS